MPRLRGSDATVLLLTDGDFGTIATSGDAACRQYIGLVGADGVVADQVRPVGVPGYHTQRSLLPGAVDHDRHLLDGRWLVHRVERCVPRAVDGCLAASKHWADNLQCFFELLESIGECAEFDAERVVFKCEPACTDPERGSALRHDVERRDGLRQHRWIAICVSRDERRQSDIAGFASERSEQHLARKHVLIGVVDLRELVEVVHHQHGVESTRVGLACLLCDSVEQFGKADAGIR